MLSYLNRRYQDCRDIMTRPPILSTRCFFALSFPLFASGLKLATERILKHILECRVGLEAQRYSVRERILLSKIRFHQSDREREGLDQVTHFDSEGSTGSLNERGLKFHIETGAKLPE